MDIDNKGKGKETEKVAEEGFTNIAGTSCYKQYISINNYTLISDESKIDLGATYDPDLLPDHCGEYLEHLKAHLIQQDHYVKKNIISYGKPMRHWIPEPSFSLMQSWTVGKWR